MKILNRYTGAVLYEDEDDSLRATVGIACANFVGADLVGADLLGANLSGADFASANLKGADLAHANLSDVIFARANLIGANFTGSNLKGAIFMDANLSGSNFAGATVSDETILPQGVTWGEFVAEVVPALLTATGKPLADAEDHFACHTWANCPMAWVFGVTTMRAVPAQWRLWASEFLRWFDADVLTWEMVANAASAAGGETP